MNSPAEIAQQEVSSPATLPTPAGREVPPGYKEYLSAQYRFSLLYPEFLAVAEHDEGGGASTLTFENADEAKGFQIFIVPFKGDQITEERFRDDIPSGVRTELKDITIDGATGAAFYSKDAILGDTAEIWFIRDGYLYEANTFKELGPWLGEVLQTWMFI